MVGLYVVLTELLTLTYLNKDLKGVFFQTKPFKLKIRDILASLFSGCTVVPRRGGRTNLFCDLHRFVFCFLLRASLDAKLFLSSTTEDLSDPVEYKR